MLSALVLYAYCGVVCLFRIRLDIIRVLSSIRLFSSAFYPPSAFSHPRFILHPPFLIRVLSSIRLFSSAFYPPSAFSHPYFLIRIRVLSLPKITCQFITVTRFKIYTEVLVYELLTSKISWKFSINIIIDVFANLVLVCLISNWKKIPSIVYRRNLP